jgi:hypothetical protein
MQKTIFSSAPMMRPLETTSPASKVFRASFLFHHKRSLARSLLKRKYTAVTWQSTQPHPEWQH